MALLTMFNGITQLYVLQLPSEKISIKNINPEKKSKSEHDNCCAIAYILLTKDQYTDFN